MNAKKPRQPKVTYRQEGGDDGYCYVIRVDGVARCAGLTRREARSAMGKGTLLARLGCPQPAGGEVMETNATRIEMTANEAIALAAAMRKSADEIELWARSIAMSPNADSYHYIGLPEIQRAPRIRILIGQDAR